MGLLSQLDRLLVKLEEVLLALLLVALIVLAATQVLLRNIWSTSIDWGDVTLQNATVLIALLGAAIATSEGRHLNIDVVGRNLSGRKRLVLHVVIGIFGVITCALLTRGGWQTFSVNYEPWLANVPEGWSALRLLRQEIAEGSFPQWLSQLMLPFGFGLIGAHFFLRLARDLTSLISGDEGDAGEAAAEGDAYLDELVIDGDEDAEEAALDVPERASPRGASETIPQRIARRAPPPGDEVEEEDEEQEEKTTAALSPKQKEAAGRAFVAAKTDKERRFIEATTQKDGKAFIEATTAEREGLDEPTVSDALSDTLAPDSVKRGAGEVAVEEEGEGSSEVKDDDTVTEEEKETLVLDREERSVSVSVDVANAPTELARVRTDSHLADAATEVAMPREEDDEEERR